MDKLNTKYWFSTMQDNNDEDYQEHIEALIKRVDIPVKAIHSLQNPYEEELKIIEVQKGDLLVEEDIIRYEDMYGRV